MVLAVELLDLVDRLAIEAECLPRLRRVRSQGKVTCWLKGMLG